MFKTNPGETHEVSHFMVGQQKKMGKLILTRITLSSFSQVAMGLCLLFTCCLLVWKYPPVGSLWTTCVCFPCTWKFCPLLSVGSAGGSLTKGCEGGFRGSSNKAATAVGSCSGNGSGANFELQLAGRNKYPFSRSCSSGWEDNSLVTQNQLRQDL